jgi:hypothetical protein
MKQFLLSIALFVFITMASTNSVYSQNACPQVSNFVIEQTGINKFKIKFEYYNPTATEKVLQVKWSGSANGQSGCFAAPKKVGNNSVIMFYISEEITTTSLENLVVLVLSYTNAQCEQGGLCSAKQSIGGGELEEIPLGTLPVSMKAFTATRSKQTVGIKFETLSESNNKGFYIQRNTNGTWENIAFIFSKADNGNSGTPISYEYNDLNPIKGVSQYRLQQVDIDLRFRYSEIRMVRGEEQPAKHLLFPNPSNDGKINIVFDLKSGTRNVLVSDMSGRVVKSFRNVSAANLSINNLENGVYSIQIIDLSTAVSSVEKVIIKRR